MRIEDTRVRMRETCVSGAHLEALNIDLHHVRCCNAMLEYGVELAGGDVHGRIELALSGPVAYRLADDRISSVARGHEDLLV